MAVAEIDTEQDTRAWVKAQMKAGTYARLVAWIESVYPDPRLRPPVREAHDILTNLALDNAETLVPPKPTPLDELAALRQQRS